MYSGAPGSSGWKSTAQALFRRLGYEVTKLDPLDAEQQFDPATTETIAAVQPFTMTSPARVAAVCDAVRHVARYDIPGAIVECGVWAGGSMMAAARTALDVNIIRDLYLFDTFEGMVAPTDLDRTPSGVLAADLAPTEGPWCYAPLAEVRRNMASTGYPEERIHYVQGKVETTVPESAPEQISILRLDTDWYESTRHELEHLAGRISSGGVLIVDDYGHWEGSRRAVDEWLEGLARPVLLSRIDSTGRIAMLP
jgi:hypothetical protein